MSLPLELKATTRLRKAEQMQGVPMPGVPMPHLQPEEKRARVKRPVTMSTFLPSEIHYVGVKDLNSQPMSATQALSVDRMRSLRGQCEG